MNSIRVLFAFLCCWSAAAADLTGFPFQNESLRYAVKLASGVSLGEASVSATKADAGGWRFELNLHAGVPGFLLNDTYRSLVTSELCSEELERMISHGPKKVTEKTTFDQKRNIAERRTTLPAGGGRSELQLPNCAQDALAYQFLARREMGQGKVPPAAKVFLGGPYEVRTQYTGAMEIPVAGKPVTTDHLNVAIKGPASELTVEVFYARDPARTPLLFKIPVPLGNISLELVR
jgi:hypothetical protein